MALSPSRVKTPMDGLIRYTQRVILCFCSFFPISVFALCFSLHPTTCRHSNPGSHTSSRIAPLPLPAAVRGFSLVERTLQSCLPSYIDPCRTVCKPLVEFQSPTNSAFLASSRPEEPRYNTGRLVWTEICCAYCRKSRHIVDLYALRLAAISAAWSHIRVSSSL